MTIALSRAQRFKAYRFDLSGEISKNAGWSQVLNFPADGAAIDLTDQDVQITFRDKESCTSASVTLSSDDAQITVTDADTLTIAVDADDLSGLCERPYVVDIVTDNSGTLTHWAQGTVMIRNSPVAWS